ncbi:MAG: arabinose isomerase [Paenibacillus sp.]|nr:arabinose isomerase [Paenibacillus sp.]
MFDMSQRQFWFAAGSQHLYGPETIGEVERHSRAIAAGLDEDAALPCPVLFKAVLLTSEDIRKLCAEASADASCAGLIVWMHTFSPAKMWIAGLTALTKPLLHLHTQFNRDIPWDTIDMDFMNANQSAHGDREFGFIAARTGIARKIIAGYWEQAEVRARIGSWMRSAAALQESRRLKVARFGDNMRQVAVTEGDKVEAQIRLGWSVNGYGVGDLAARVREVSEDRVDVLMDEYDSLYAFAPDARGGGPAREAVRYQARLELALKAFLDEGGYGAFTTTFEDLHGLEQLPGLAVQRLMGQGYGFGGEGDWKTAALVRLTKLIAGGEGTSFMEDYTYHLEPGRELTLGAHMLEVCPSIAANKPRIEVHPLGIGGKAAPARLVFDGRAGAARNVSLIDAGGRFRLIVSEVEAVDAPHPMPQLPVARVLWRSAPSLQQAAEAWILAGGAHHTCFSYKAETEQLLDWADMVGIEAVLIDNSTTMRQLRQELQWNELAWKLKH